MVSLAKEDISRTVYSTSTKTQQNGCQKILQILLLTIITCFDKLFSFNARVLSFIK